MSQHTIPYQQEQKVKTNGIHLSYDSFGDASNPPILLIMGLATQMIHWDTQFCQMLAAKGFWVIRFDNRDIGNSEKLHSAEVPNIPVLLAKQWIRGKMNVPYLLDDMAHDVFGLLDALNINKTHVVGVSMGGMIAQCMALMAPHRLLSLTSIMSTTGNRKLPKPKTSVSLQMIKPVPKEDQAYLAHAMEMWKTLHGGHFEFDTQRIKTLLIAAKNRSFYTKGIIRQLSAILASEDRTEKLKSLDLPTLVLHGDADPLVPVECGYATAKAIPNAKLKIYPGMGHTLPKELWADMIEEIYQLTQTRK